MVGPIVAPQPDVFTRVVKVGFTVAPGSVVAPETSSRSPITPDPWGAPAEITSDLVLESRKGAFFVGRVFLEKVAPDPGMFVTVTTGDVNLVSLGINGRASIFVGVAGGDSSADFVAQIMDDTVGTDILLGTVELTASLDDVVTTTATGRVTLVIS